MDLPIYDKVSVITGYSATGKTKLLNWIKACKELYSINPKDITECSKNFDDILIITTKEECKSLLLAGYSHKIIFIDRFNYISNEELNNFVINSENIFILVGHGNTANFASQDAILGVRYEKGEYHFYQIYENGILNATDII